MMLMSGTSYRMVSTHLPSTSSSKLPHSVPSSAVGSDEGTNVRRTWVSGRKRNDER